MSRPVRSSHSTPSEASSEGGVSLTLGEATAEKIRVGELIGYRDGPEDPWAIGSVRWMQFLPGRGLSIGVRKLTTAAVAIGGRAVEGTGSGGEFFRMLLTAPIEQLDNARLITPAAIFDVGTKVLLVHGDKVQYIRLSELVETTRSFSSFRCETGEKPKVKTPLIAPSTLSPF